MTGAFRGRPPTGIYYKIGGKFMGKRELLIIVAFLAIGALVYQVSAPPAAEGRGFSFSRLMDSMRREMRGNPGHGAVERTQRIALRPDVAELRVSEVPRGVEIIGEAREDIEYVLKVESNGPDDAAAKTSAEKVAVVEDDLGFALALKVTYPREGSQTASLVLRVPERLTLRIDGRSIKVSNLASVDLDPAVGDTQVSGVAGALTGTHRTGRLIVEGAGSVDVSLQSSRATFTKVRDGVTISARSGECAITDSAGTIEIEQINVDLSITAPLGAVRVGGNGGQVSIVDPHAGVRVETRESEVEVALNRAVPVSVVTTGETLRLLVSDEGAVAIDAVASNGGRIQAAEFEAEAETTDRDARLSLTIGSGKPERVILRNSDGEIVIRRRR